MSDAGLIGVEARLRQLANAGEDVLGYAPTSETDQGVYFLVLRRYPHPDADDASVLNLRYAYLTRGEGSDGWLDNGINMRVEGDPDDFVLNLARLLYTTQDGDHELPTSRDMRPPASR